VKGAVAGGVVETKNNNHRGDRNEIWSALQKMKREERRGGEPRKTEERSNQVFGNPLREKQGGFTALVMSQ